MRLTTLLLATAMVAPAAAEAQSADDVVVMRRFVAPAKRLPGTPAPSASPTPSQSPTPSGTPVPTPVPTPPPTTEGLHWQEYGWGDFEDSCSPRTVKRQRVTCENVNGDAFPDSSCSFATKPLTEIYGASTSGCVGQWRATGYQWDSQCSPNAVEVQEVRCVSNRGDGYVIEDRYCTGAGARPTEYGRREARYEGCASFAWTTGEWGNWSNGACSTTATHTRTVTCGANDGKGNVHPVPDAPWCQNAGTKPPATETASVSTGCEMIQNPGMDPAGGSWSFGTGASFASNGSSPALRLVSPPSGEAAAAWQLVNIVQGRRYDWSYEIRTIQPGATCTRSDRSPMALWYDPNPYTNYSYQNQYLCGTTTQTKSGSFVATYTGRTNMVFWAEPEAAGRPVTMYIDNVSVRQAQ